MIVAIVGDDQMSSNDVKMVQDAVNASGYKVDRVVSGGAKGADTSAVRWAKSKSIEYVEHLAKWKDLTAPDAVIRTGPYGKYDANAGFRRNQLIVDDSDAVIVLQPNGKTPGSQNTVTKAN